MKYPKTIYIQYEQNGDEGYHLAHEELEDANDGEIAVYELVEIKTKKTKTYLEPTD